MKKVVSLFLALCLVMSVCVTAFAADSVEFWNDKLGETEKGAACITTWTAAAGVEIMNTNYPDTASYQTALTQSIDVASAAPDIFTWWSGSQLESLATSGKIQPLDDVWETIVAAGVAPSIADAFTFDGHAYAVPYSVLYTYTGDFTDWWADGVGSTPAAVKMYLEAQRNYDVAKKLDPEGHFSDPALVEQAEHNMMLYAEHT